MRRVMNKCIEEIWLKIKLKELCPLHRSKRLAHEGKFWNEIFVLCTVRMILVGDSCSICRYINLQTTPVADILQNR